MFTLSLLNFPSLGNCPSLLNRPSSAVLASACCLLALAASNAASETDDLLEAVRGHADLIIEHAKDRWGEHHTEQFADGLHVDDHRPTVWQEKRHARVLSNFASQQVWLRTLAALTTVSGDQRYQQQADATMADAYARLRSPDGLLYWGGHLAYDLERDEAWGMWNNGHEVKNHYPWFAGLHRVDAAATEQLMQSLWLSHMEDWRTLLFNRHGRITRPGRQGELMQPTDGWDYPYAADIELPLRPKGSQLSFINAASSLIYTALCSYQLTGSTDLATWGLRLADRYWAMRHPDTGLGGYQFNVRRQRDSGDKAEQQYGDLLGDRAREWLLITPLNVRQVGFPLAMLLAAERCPADSPIRQRLISETIPEWLAYYAAAYDASNAQWLSISTDGQPLPYQRMTANGYYHRNRWLPRPSSGMVLQLAALAHRLQPSAATQSALNELLTGMGLVETTSGQSPVLSLSDTVSYDGDMLFALLDIDRALPELGAHALALQMARAMLDQNRVGGLFVADDQRIWASINTRIPLAILHVIAYGQQGTDALPAPFPDSGFLHAPFKGVQSKNWGRTTDGNVFYNRTRAEPTVTRDPSTGR